MDIPTRISIRLAGHGLRILHGCTGPGAGPDMSLFLFTKKHHRPGDEPIDRLQFRPATRGISPTISMGHSVEGVVRTLDKVGSRPPKIWTGTAKIHRSGNRSAAPYRPLQTSATTRPVELIVFYRMHRERRWERRPSRTCCRCRPGERAAHLCRCGIAAGGRYRISAEDADRRGGVERFLVDWYRDFYTCVRFEGFCKKTSRKGAAIYEHRTHPWTSPFHRSRQTRRTPLARPAVQKLIVPGDGGLVISFSHRLELAVAGAPRPATDGRPSPRALDRHGERITNAGLRLCPDRFFNRSGPQIRWRSCGTLNRCRPGLSPGKAPDIVPPTLAFEAESFTVRWPRGCWGSGQSSMRPRPGFGYVFSSTRPCSRNIASRAIVKAPC